MTTFEVELRALIERWLERGDTPRGQNHLSMIRVLQSEGYRLTCKLLGVSVES